MAGAHLVAAARCSPPYGGVHNGFRTELNYTGPSGSLGFWPGARERWADVGLDSNPGGPDGIHGAEASASAWVTELVRPTPDEPVRVLICDDDPVMSSALEDLLRHAAGIQIVGVATDTASAAALAVELVPDVVLLDVRMPGGGGPVAARAIHKALPDVRIVAYSAHADRRVVRQMLRAGAVEYLVKALDSSDDIVDALRRTGRGHFSLALAETEEMVFDLLELLEQAEQAAQASTQGAASTA